jgi:hypothetical protein
LDLVSKFLFIYSNTPTLIRSRSSSGPPLFLGEDESGAPVHHVSAAVAKHRKMLLSQSVGLPETQPLPLSGNDATLVKTQKIKGYERDKDIFRDVASGDDEDIPLRKGLKPPAINLDFHQQRTDVDDNEFSGTLIRSTVHGYSNNNDGSIIRVKGNSSPVSRISADGSERYEKAKSKLEMQAALKYFQDEPIPISKISKQNHQNQLQNDKVSIENQPRLIHEKDKNSRSKIEMNKDNYSEPFKKNNFEHKESSIIENKLDSITNPDNIEDENFPQQSEVIIKV